MSGVVQPSRCLRLRREIPPGIGCPETSMSKCIFRITLNELRKYYKEAIYSKSLTRNAIRIFYVSTEVMSETRSPRRVNHPSVCKFVYRYRHIFELVLPYSG